MDKMTLTELIERFREEADSTDTSELGGEGYAEGCEWAANRLESWIQEHIQ
jgi:hypothetical protein